MPRISQLAARDVMQKGVATLSPEDTIERALALFQDSRIGGAPVVDVGGRLGGVLTLSDVNDDEVREERDARRRGTFDMSDPVGEELGDELDPGAVFTLKEDYSPRVLGRALVGDRMTPEVISVTTRTTLADVCAAMVENRVHRVFVTEDERLVGVISTFDVARCVAGAKSPSRTRPSASRSGGAVRRRASGRRKST